jgi:hypothetical protein
MWSKPTLGLKLNKNIPPINTNSTENCPQTIGSACGHKCWIYSAVVADWYEV